MVSCLRRFKEVSGFGVCASIEVSLYNWRVYEVERSNHLYSMQNNIVKHPCIYQPIRVLLLLG